MVKKMPFSFFSFKGKIPPTRKIHTNKFLTVCGPVSSQTESRQPFGGVRLDHPAKLISRGSSGFSVFSLCVPRPNRLHSREGGFSPHPWLL